MLLRDSGNKRALGRNAGPNVDPSATRNQRGPTGITKVEDTHVFGSSFFLTGRYGFVDGGAELIAVGGAGPRPTSIYRSWPTRFSAGRRTIASDWLQPRVSAALP